ncbi:unnamed protein product [Gadus morhua 'NCC']
MEDPAPLSAELCTPTGVPNWFRAPEEGRLAPDQPDILGSAFERDAAAQRGSRGNPSQPIFYVKQATAKRRAVGAEESPLF